jgi:hypothetical protein
MKANNAEILAALSEQFPENLVRTRIGGGGTKLRWVPARSVSERLDQVLGVTGWDFSVTKVDEKNTVHGVLKIKLADGSFATREDFGYETGGSGESLKEAASDALRRCASLFGVARYLYQGESGTLAAHKNVGATGGLETHVVRAPDVLDQDFELAQKAMQFAANVADGECPRHRTAWVVKPGGTSKFGKPYAAFWSCGAKDDSGWCRNKPSLAWLAKNPAESAASETKKREEDVEFANSEPKFTSQDVGEDLPF